jgi:hypothetical protein
MILPQVYNETKETTMNKISIALLALAALSTTALANDNRDSRGSQDSMSLFTPVTAGVFGPKVLKKADSTATQYQAFRLFEKNGTTDSGA